MRYFLYDCYGQKAGAPKGYKTFEYAARAEKRLGHILRSRFETMRESVPYAREVSRIGQA